jgi:electron transport complex protein RnfC
MTFTRTFPKGGIVPEPHKPTARSSIRNAALPAEAVVPLAPYGGRAARPVVSPGERVEEGMVIGKSTGRASAHVHAPIPGVVTELREVQLGAGRSTNCIVIALEGAFRKLGRPQQPAKWQHLQPSSLLSRIRSMGVVALDGSNAPVHQLLSAATENDIDYLLVNGAESEPYLSSAHRLMVEQTERIIGGARIAERIAEPHRVLIGVEADKPDAIRALRHGIRRQELSYDVVPLRVKYPQSDRHQLAKALTGRELGASQSDVAIGCVTMDVATLLAIHEGVVEEKPLVERVVTVAGSAVKEPANLKVRLGTSLAYVLSECGGLVEEPAKVIIGGPMRGRAVTDLSLPVTKDTTAVLALTEEEVGTDRQQPCIECGACVRACPMGIEPERLHKFVQQGRTEEALADGILDCTECGACSYVCPSHIPLLEELKRGKRALRQGGMTEEHA